MTPSSPQGVLIGLVALCRPRGGHSPIAIAVELPATFQMRGLRREHHGLRDGNVSGMHEKSTESAGASLHFAGRLIYAPAIRFETSIEVHMIHGSPLLGTYRVDVCEARSLYVLEVTEEPIDIASRSRSGKQGIMGRKKALLRVPHSHTRGTLSQSRRRKPAPGPRQA